MYNADWKKYFFVFLITLAIFATAFYASSQLNNKKIEEIQTIQNRVAIDVLSSETQFSLLAESSCETIGDTSLSKDLDSLGAKLSYAEENIGSNSEDILWLEKNYSLLEIKDFILTKKVAERCAIKPAYILYFYSNVNGTCPDCQKEGLVLTDLRNSYPGLRVYSFDFDLDLSALNTLETLYKIKGNLPVLVIDGKTYQGFQSIALVEKLIPNLKDLVPKNTATTTLKTKNTKK